ncbi:MAG: hypothetical protein HY811_08455 [Planctomycetes bacterium]|nr:hypothetical protein [Planctomycetota bacterium]
MLKSKWLIFTAFLAAMIICPNADVLAEGKKKPAPAPKKEQKKEEIKKKVEEVKKEAEKKKQEQQNNNNNNNIATDSSIEEAEINWKTERFDESFSLMREEQKPLFLYFYFSDKEQFPPNYDNDIVRYSKEKAIFASIFVEVNKKGEIVDPEINEFYKINKLKKGGVAVILDQYGNFMEQIPVPPTNKKVLDAFDKVADKIEDIIEDLDKRWEKIAKLKEKENKTELIKELNGVIKTNRRGYKGFVNAEKELKTFEDPLRRRFSEIARKYMEKGCVDEENRRETIANLQNLLKDSNDLPVKGDIESAVEKVKKGESLEVESIKDVKEGKELKDKKTESKKEDDTPPEIDIDEPDEELVPVGEE